MPAPNIVNVQEIIPHTQSIVAADTSRTALVSTPPVGSAYKINQIIIANTSISAVNATVEVRLSDGISYRAIGSTISVPANTTLVVLNKNTSLYLLDTTVTGEANTLWATSSTANALTFTVSYEAIVIPVYYSLYSWGQNNFGQLGLGNTTYYSSPKQVGALINWSSAAGGNSTTLTIKADGTLWSWGRNDFGQLGLGNITNYFSPKQVGALTTWSSITSGAYHTIAIKTDGSLWAWGRNNSGQLSLGNITNYSSPKQVGALTNWLTIASGFYHTIAIKTDGSLWAWGRNSAGQLGLGNVTNYNSPKQVGALTNWLHIAGGYSHTIALKTDGSLWAWGRNSDGQLGLGNSGVGTYRSSPVQVGALTNWSSIVCGIFYTIALKTDGTLWSWGSNGNGQLGLGNITKYSSPKQVGTLTTWVHIASGYSHTIAIKS